MVLQNGGVDNYFLSSKKLTADTVRRVVRKIVIIIYFITFLLRLSFAY